MAAQQIDVIIDRLSPVPLYHQLAEQLSGAIATGQLQPGDPFENEIAVAERLQLSRPTVRRAIAELADQGLLVRRRGLGTTVANRKVHRRVELTSLYDDLESEGRTPRTTVLVMEAATNEQAAAALDLPADTEQHGLYATLRRQGVKPVVARQSIGARKPTAAERRHLDIRGGHPVLTMTRMAFDSGGNAVEDGDHAYRASDYTIDLMVDER